jgi:hypothetical protein
MDSKRFRKALEVSERRLRLSCCHQLLITPPRACNAAAATGSRREGRQQAACRPEHAPSHLSYLLPQEWVKDHKMFAATLEELAGQLATLEPPPPGGASSASSGSGSTSTEPSELMQRLLAKAPSAQLQAYASSAAPPACLQRLLPEQLDQNLRLLGILSAEMRSFLRQMEGLADAAAAALAGGDSSAVDGDEALLMAAVLDGAAKEMQLIVSQAG